MAVSAADDVDELDPDSVIQTVGLSLVRDSVTTLGLIPLPAGLPLRRGGRGKRCRRG